MENTPKNHWNGLPGEVKGYKSPGIFKKLGKHLSRIIEEKLIMSWDGENRLDPSSPASDKSYATAKGGKKATENWNCVQEFKLVLAHYFSSHISSCICVFSTVYSYHDLARPNYV